MTRQDYLELSASLRDAAESMWASGDRATDSKAQVEMYDEARELDKASVYAAGKAARLNDDDDGM